MGRLWTRTSISIGALSGNLEGAHLVGTLKDMCGKALDKGIYLHRGPVREPGGGSFSGDFERRTKEDSGNRTPLWEHCEENMECGGVPFLAKLKDMLLKALEMGVFLHRGPVGDHERVAHLPGTLTDRNIWAPFPWTQRKVGV